MRSLRSPRGGSRGGPSGDGPSIDHVFLGFSEIAGYYGQLAAGLREAGVRVTMLAVRPHPFGYPVPGDQPRLIRAANRLAMAAGRRVSPGRRLAWTLLAGVVQAAAFGQALVVCTGFVIGWPTSVMHRVVFGVIRLLGKPTVVVFHGADHRPPVCDGSYRGTGGVELAAEAARRQRQVKAAQGVGTVVANPLSAQFHTMPFVRFQSVGIPLPPAGGEPPTGPAAGGPVRVLHAPSDTGVKGTDVIRGIVARLQEAGEPIEYVELTGVPHDRVEHELARCDLVVDQCWSDTPMAGLQAEAARLGVASVAGSHGARVLDRFLPPGDRPPAVLVHPEELPGAVASLVHDPARLRELGDAARRFVTTEWRRDEVARRFLAILQGEAPEAWSCRPDELAYVWGCGLQKAQVRERIAAVLAARGPSGLGLDHAPMLRDAFVTVVERT